MMHGRFQHSLVVLLAVGLVVAVLSMPAGAAKQVVRIGFIGPLTGPNASLGIGARNAADLAVRQANEQNFPYAVELVVLDDASDPTTGVAAATKLGSDPLVVGATTHFNSPVGLATIHVFHRNGIAQVFWGGIHPDITNKHNFAEVTRVCPNTFVEHDTLGKFVIEKLGLKRWAMIYDMTSYGKSSLDAAKKAVAKMGGTVTSEDGIAVGTVDFRPILSRIKASQPAPQVVYFGGVVTEAALIRIQMHELAMKQLYTGVTGFDSETFNTTAKEMAEGTLIIGKAHIDDASPFVKAYRAGNYREPYEATGPYAYDAVNIILEAVRKVGPDRKAIVRAIREGEHRGIVGVTKFDSFGQSTSGGLTIKVSQDRRWTLWEASDYAKGTRALLKP
jgi:branched-chain amino acid transport system substrate-binding protein